MTSIAPEYVVARKVLLDALAALKPQLDSVVLVGAQAVYHHTGVVEGTGIAMTTDGDLALNADLLTSDPELTGALKDAGFTEGRQPGSWMGEGGVNVDLMVVPHQSNRAAGARAADLPPHEKWLARITPGLEPALVDNKIAEITALDEADDRTVSLRIAGPAALLVAKLTKIREREEQVAAGKANPARLVRKDAVDSYRLLLIVSTADLVKGFESHRSSPEALGVSQAAVTYLAAQLRAGTDGHLRTMLATELPDDEVLLAQFDALADDLVTALGAAGFDVS